MKRFKYRNLYVFYATDGENWSEIWAQTYRSDQRSNQKDYFDQIIAHWSLIDRVIGSESKRDLSNPTIYAVGFISSITPVTTELLIGKVTTHFKKGNLSTLQQM